MTMSLCECLSLGLSGDYMFHYNKNASESKEFLLAAFSQKKQKAPRGKPWGTFCRHSRAFSRSCRREKTLTFSIIAEPTRLSRENKSELSPTLCYRVSGVLKMIVKTTCEKTRRVPANSYCPGTCGIALGSIGFSPWRIRSMLSVNGIQT